MKDINDVYDNSKYAKLNNDRINFVSNVLGQENYLENNPYERRILIGRGPVIFVNDVMKKGHQWNYVHARQGRASDT